MEEQAKIRIGGMELDGVIDVEMKKATEHYTNEIREAMKNMRAQLTQSFSVTRNFNMTEEGTPGIIDDNVVEGSLIEPITDPTKLLGESKA